MCWLENCTAEGCGKPTWAGCGRHIENVLGEIADDDRCACERVVHDCACGGNFQARSRDMMLRVMECHYGMSDACRGEDNYMALHMQAVGGEQAVADAAAEVAASSSD